MTLLRQESVPVGTRVRFANTMGDDSFNEFIGEEGVVERCDEEFGDHFINVSFDNGTHLVGYYIDRYELAETTPRITIPLDDNETKEIWY